MDKKAILLVSIGTSQIEALERSSLQLLEEIKDRFKGYAYYMAISSEFILNKLNKLNEVHYMSVQEAFQNMQLDGIQEVFVQPTFLLNGLESDKLRVLVEENQNNFKKIEIGSPLLAKKEEYVDILQALLTEAKLDDDEALLLIGHGTTHSANTTYQNLEYTAYIQGMRSIFVGTMDGGKSQRMLLRKLNAAGYRKICILPFLFVAGYHAWKDISADENSWRSVLEEAEYEVRPVIKGLGEQKQIRDIFLKHLESLLELTEVEDAKE